MNSWSITLPAVDSVHCASSFIDIYNTPTDKSESNIEYFQFLFFFFFFSSGNIFLCTNVPVAHLLAGIQQLNMQGEENRPETCTTVTDLAVGTTLFYCSCVSIVFIYNIILFVCL